MRWLAALLLALVVAGCTVDGEPRGGGEIEPTPERVDRALRFAALTPLPGGASVVRLEAQSGIDTRVQLVVRLAPADGEAWLAASGLPAGVQQRVANPDGAIVHREATVPAGAGPVDVSVTAFTT